MKILVTGANGLLGRSVAELLTTEKHQVIAVVRKPAEEAVQDVQYLPIDLGSDWSISQLPSQVDAIIHLAQSNSFRDFPKSALDVFQVNVSSTARLLDYASKIGIQIFILASSGGVYGTGDKPFKEDSAVLNPLNLGYYLGSKVASEILLHSYQSTFQTTAMRFFYIYGPRQRRTMLIPRLMDNVRNRKEITLNGANGMRLNPIHVRDAADAVVRALSITGIDVFNVCGPEILSLRQIAESMGDHLGIRPVFQQASSESRDMIGDNQLMRDKLYNPKKRLREVLYEIA